MNFQLTLLISVLYGTLCNNNKVLIPCCIIEKSEEL